MDSLGRPALFDSFTVLSVGLVVGAAMNATRMYRGAPEPLALVPEGVGP